MQDYKSLRVKPDVHKDVKDLADEEGRSINKIIEIAISIYKCYNCKEEEQLQK